MGIMWVTMASELEFNNLLFYIQVYEPLSLTFGLHTRFDRWWVSCLWIFIPKITFFSSVFSDFSEIMAKLNDFGPIISSDEESKGKFYQIQDLFSKLYLLITVHFNKKYNLLVRSHIVVWCKQKVKLWMIYT